MDDNDVKKLTLRSSFDQINRLEPFLNRIQKWIQPGEEQFSQIRLALNEAVTNAIVHGNKEDESKKVYISARKNENTLKISVRDEGPGFDPSSLANPLKEENLLKESGRGIFLIKESADRVKFSQNATKLTMHFKLDD